MKDRLLRKGYCPENLPPAFTSELVANYFASKPKKGYFGKARNSFRPATYNASKRGITRRVFSLVHPVTAHDTAEFVTQKWKEIQEFFEQVDTSLSAPKVYEESERAVVIGSHNELDKVRLTELARFRFIAKTDISRFYHSIYTHSLPWAFHGKSQAKADRNPASATTFFNKADQIVRLGQDGQTMGIPVGPDTSRILAEVISTAIDLAFFERCEDTNFAIIRHVDDVWIGADTHESAERILWRYREAIREFELDINENKTQILSQDFQFSDQWPSEISTQLDTAINSPENRVAERMRAACENAFARTASNSDDAILKYVIRYLDKSEFHWKQWGTVEPFLKRAAVHFGHTIDYVVRVIVWRHLVHGDLDVLRWTPILQNLMDRHGRLGNDSEVCWIVYACIRLEIKIPNETSELIIENCGALSILSLLNCIKLKLVDNSMFNKTRKLLKSEDDTGPYWPIFLEWKSRKWPQHSQMSLSNDLLHELAKNEIVIYDPSKLPLVFKDAVEADFGSITAAIEEKTSEYDDIDDDFDDHIDIFEFDALFPTEDSEDNDDDVI